METHFIPIQIPRPEDFVTFQHEDLLPLPTMVLERQQLAERILENDPKPVEKMKIIYDKVQSILQSYAEFSGVDQERSKQFFSSDRWVEVYRVQLNTELEILHLTRTALMTSLVLSHFSDPEVTQMLTAFQVQMPFPEDLKARFTTYAEEACQEYYRQLDEHFGNCFPSIGSELAAKSHLVEELQQEGLGLPLHNLLNAEYYLKFQNNCLNFDA